MAFFPDHRDKKLNSIIRHGQRHMLADSIVMHTGL